MRFIRVGLICLLGLGCASQTLVYQSTPTTKLTSEETTQLVGTVRPWGLDSTVIVSPSPQGTRMVVLSLIGIKLLDVFIAANRTIVYFQQEKLPVSAIHAWVRFARAELQNACIKKDILYRDISGAEFEFEAKGVKVCH